MIPRAAIALLALVVAAACSTPAALKYRCDLQPTTGNAVTGWVTFEEMQGHVHVKAEVRGLTPGKHGFHIHEKGDCSSGDGKSAGGHFNPEGVDHAGPDAPKRHAGDLGNLTAGEDDLATYDRMDTVIRMTGLRSILGRGVIVHEKEDDLSTQPTGAAGARVACGIIRQAQAH